jgi:cell division protein FtsQ
MAIKINIRKILFLALWIAAGSFLLVLLVAAITKKNHAACTGIRVTIKGGNTLFLDRQDVLNTIAPGRNNPYKGKPLASFNLNRLEDQLRRNVWVKDADLFFDNNGLLRVNIDERDPIARVFTTEGSSYYIDSACAHLPLSDKMAVRLPVFTGFPSEKTVLRGADSLLMQQVKQLSLYMMKDTFWLAQVQQVAITGDRAFEMIPVIGNHTILFGDGNDYEAKFHRLLLFYQQVAAKFGFEKYSAVNVAYAGQVIGVKKGTVSKVDSLQALKNIQQMIEASHRLPVDTLSTIVDNNIMVTGASGSILPVLNNRRDSAGAVAPNTSKDTLNRVPAQPIHPSSMKSRAPSRHPVQRPPAKRSVPPKEKPKPKAVMHKR